VDLSHSCYKTATSRQDPQRGLQYGAISGHKSDDKKSRNLQALWEKTVAGRDVLSSNLSSHQARQNVGKTVRRRSQYRHRMAENMSAKTYGFAPWMKKARVFGYARISTEKQSAADRKQTDTMKKPVIKRQIEEVNTTLKGLGVKQIKAGDWYAEVASGTRRDRPQWLKMIAEAINEKGPALVVVKDPSRWARNTRAAVRQADELMMAGVPVFAVSTGLQTGDDTHGRRPSEFFFFLVNSGFAAQTSEIQAEKAISGVARQLKEGALAGEGTSLYPFARSDPYAVILQNPDLQKTLSKNKFAEMINLVTGDDGPSIGAAKASVNKFTVIRAKLKPKELEEYMEFRQRLRDILLEKDSDPWTSRTKTKKGSKANYYQMRALLRMAGLYLAKPYEYAPLFEHRIQEIMREFPRFLSDKDKDRRGHR
jgi:DNA invertase Pin-like site-specific DNA recombinase